MKTTIGPIGAISPLENILSRFGVPKLPPGTHHQQSQSGEGVILSEQMAHKSTFPQWLASDSLVRSTPSWCHEHLFGYRNSYGLTHCLTCKPPTSPDSVTMIVESVEGLIVQHDPWLLPDDGDAQEFICERAAIREFDGGFDRINAQKLASLEWWRTKAK